MNTGIPCLTIYAGESIVRPNGLSSVVGVLFEALYLRCGVFFRLDVSATHESVAMGGLLLEQKVSVVALVANSIALVDNAGKINPAPASSMSDGAGFLDCNWPPASGKFELVSPFGSFQKQAKPTPKARKFGSW